MLLKKSQFIEVKYVTERMPNSYRTLSIWEGGSIKNIIRKVPRSQIEVRMKVIMRADNESQQKNLWNQTAEAACLCSCPSPGMR